MLFERNWATKTDPWFLRPCPWLVAMSVTRYFLEVSARWYGGRLPVVPFVASLLATLWLVSKPLGYFKFGGCHEKSVIPALEELLKERLRETIHTKLFVSKAIFEPVSSDAPTISFMKIPG